jgi:hypothetical protein
MIRLALSTLVTLTTVGLVAAKIVGVQTRAVKTCGAGCELVGPALPYAPQSLLPVGLFVTATAFGLFALYVVGRPARWVEI